MVHRHFWSEPGNYGQTVVDVVGQYAPNQQDDGRRALNILDVDCGAGGVRYGLAGYFGGWCAVDVVGIDDSATMIGLANRMQQNSRLEYEFGHEMEVVIWRTGLRPISLRVASSAEWSGISAQCR